ncbi:MAG: aminoacyl-tRNA hydrolase [Dehalococcoidia bacterium]|nr:aminoacyl-tRNA hydrolase [Dehalococcoidia bacterium]
MKLIVGLGNPGNQYASNRHNVGFMCVAHFAKKRGWSFEKKEGLARTAHGKLNGEEIVLARPQTFMNASGEAVKKLTVKYHIKPEDLMVIHDDMDLNLGIIRIRQGGSSAGHNGIESIIYEFGTANFIRLRIGVEHPSEAFTKRSTQVIGHVLGDFSDEETGVIKEVINEVDLALTTIVSDGLDCAMNRFNKSNTSPPPRSNRLLECDEVNG